MILNFSEMSEDEKNEWAIDLINEHGDDWANKVKSLFPDKPPAWKTQCIRNIGMRYMQSIGLNSLMTEPSSDNNEKDRKRSLAEHG